MNIKHDQIWISATEANENVRDQAWESVREVLMDAAWKSADNAENEEKEEE